MYAGGNGYLAGYNSWRSVGLGPSECSPAEQKCQREATYAAWWAVAIACEKYCDAMTTGGRTSSEAWAGTEGVRPKDISGSDVSG